MKPTESFSRMNVTEAGLDVPERDQIPFDPDRDISPAHWQTLLAAVEESRRKRGIMNVAQDLALLSMIDPARAKPSLLEKKLIREKLEILRTRSDLWSFRFLSADASILDSSLVDLTPQDLELMKREVQGFSLAELRLTGLAQLSILDRGGFQLADADRAGIIDYLNKTRASGNGVALAEAAADVARIDPLLLDLTPEDWDVMNGTLLTIRQNANTPEIVLQLTANLSYLSRLFRSARPTSDISPPLPETKSYTS